MAFEKYSKTRVSKRSHGFNLTRWGALTIPIVIFDDNFMPFYDIFIDRKNKQIALDFYPDRLKNDLLYITPPLKGRKMCISILSALSELRIDSFKAKDLAIFTHKDNRVFLSFKE